MRRVVVTGIGIVSCLGADKQTVLESLREGRSGIRSRPEYKEMGLRSHIAGWIDLDLSAMIDRKILRFMGDAAAFGYLSMEQAIADAGLKDDEVSNIRTASSWALAAHPRRIKWRRPISCAHKGFARLDPIVSPALWAAPCQPA